MKKTNYSSSGLKLHVREILLSDSFSPECIFEEYSPRLVLASLFSMYFDSSELLRWRAITATGSIVARMADENMESARIVMRRLMWTLNDESGGIGWGSPEAMGEIMARHGRLADEYHRILISYMMEDGNYIELEVLQRGVLWAVARMAAACPDLGIKAKGLVKPYFMSRDNEIKGFAAMLAGVLRDEAVIEELEKLISDQNEINIYADCEIRRVTVSSLASDAVLRIRNRS
jgi:hypothetical protein